MQIQNMTENVIMGIIGVVLLLTIVAGTATIIIAAVGNIGVSGLPLSGIWSSNGVMLVAYSAAVIVAAITLVFGAMKIRSRR